MAIKRLSARLVIVTLIAAFGLAACGRNGPLGLPPGAAAQPAPAALAPSPTATGPESAAAAQEAAQRNGFDAQGNPVAAPGQKKAFILDPLLQ